MLEQEIYLMNYNKVSINSWAPGEADSEVEIRVCIGFYKVLLGSTPKGKKRRKRIGNKKSSCSTESVKA